MTWLAGDHSQAGGLPGVVLLPLKGDAHTHTHFLGEAGRGRLNNENVSLLPPSILLFTPHSPAHAKAFPWAGRQAWAVSLWRLQAQWRGRTSQLPPLLLPTPASLYFSSLSPRKVGRVRRWEHFMASIILSFSCVLFFLPLSGRERVAWREHMLCLSSVYPCCGLLNVIFFSLNYVSSNLFSLGMLFCMPFNIKAIINCCISTMFLLLEHFMYLKHPTILWAGHKLQHTLSLPSMCLWLLSSQMAETGHVETVDKCVVCLSTCLACLCCPRRHWTSLWPLLTLSQVNKLFLVNMAFVSLLPSLF